MAEVKLEDRQRSITHVAIFVASLQLQWLSRLLDVIITDATWGEFSRAQSGGSSDTNTCGVPLCYVRKCMFVLHVEYRSAYIHRVKYEYFFFLNMVNGIRLLEKEREWERKRL